MNWKIIIQLSAFGLIIALATISLIPQNIEPVFWLVIFSFCAWVIAKVCSGKYFLHGFLVSLVNCIWIVAAHIIFYKSYIAHHPDMASMNKSMPPSLAVHPRLSMAVVGPIFGIVSGIILGVFAIFAAAILKKR